MKVLIIGGGGREHALAWKVAQSDRVEKVFVAPGNAGTATENLVENIAIEAEDIPALLEFAQDNGIELTIVGPEVPLVAGIVDVFEQAGLRCFGPSRKAAQLEGSKTFCKEFLTKYNIATAEYSTFSDSDEAIAYIQAKGLPIVIKADGLAAGKGVVISTNLDHALATGQDMLSGNSLGEAGSRVVIEEYLQGEEVSFIVIADGRIALPMATSQDHKPRDNGNMGPNTVGMGAYSPAPIVTPEIHDRIMAEIIRPTLKGMANEGAPYVGFLYAGLMISADGTPRVLEFNCRFGDPETQPIMMRLNSDLIALCEAALDRKLNSVQAEWDSRAALGVVLAASGYPGAYEKGDVISGLTKKQPIDSKLFHAGTKHLHDKTVTSGGRVLCASALGDTLSDARNKAYRLAKNIAWPGIDYRTDIGYGK